MKTFIIHNDYAEISVLDADFSIVEDHLPVDDEIPEEVINAIIILRKYATKVEASVA
jgi:hypothetical protein